MYDSSHDNLRPSVNKRIEMEHRKKEMHSLSEANKKQRFVAKQEKVLKHGWKHGVLGIELPGEFEDSMLYDVRERDARKRDQRKIQQRR